MAIDRRADQGAEDIVKLPRSHLHKVSDDATKAQQFSIGDSAKIVGLKKQKEYNGLEAKIISYEPVLGGKTSDKLGSNVTSHQKKMMMSWLYTYTIHHGYDLPVFQAGICPPLHDPTYCESCIFFLGKVLR